jgi:hypothetical protein
MKHWQLISVLSLMALLCAMPVWGQITITSSDFPNTIGFRASHSCSDFTTAVNPGPAGANQTWDLQGIPVVQTADFEIVDRNDTPNPSWFPSANRILKATGEGETIASYTYEELTGGYLKNLGMAFTVPESSYAVQWTNDPPYAVFPMQYQGSWMTRLYWEKSVMGFTMAADDSAWITVDGWGTVIVDEVGSRPCLRLKLHHHLVVTLNGNPTGDDWYWAYIWMTSGHGEGASMESENGADENFTEGYFCRWGGGADAEEPVRIVPLAFELQSPYPNPFNPETTIPYSVNTLTEVELAIYNAIGQKVRTLVSGQVLPGSYSITWNAADNAGNSVGTGVYYCRLSSLQGNASVQRLVLLR